MDSREFEAGELRKNLKADQYANVKPFEAEIDPFSQDFDVGAKLEEIERSTEVLHKLVQDMRGGMDRKVLGMDIEDRIKDREIPIRGYFPSYDLLGNNDYFRFTEEAIRGCFEFARKFRIRRKYTIFPVKAQDGSIIYHNDYMVNWLLKNPDHVEKEPGAKEFLERYLRIEAEYDAGARQNELT